MWQDHIHAVIRARIKTGIERSICVEPPDAVARLPGQICEITADENLAVWLWRDDIYAVIRAGIETGIKRSVCVEPPDAVARLATKARECAAHQNLAIGLNH